MGAAGTGPYGQAGLITPNVDKLASEGLVFDAYPVNVGSCDADYDD